MGASPGRLAGSHVFVAQGDADHVIPRELLDRTWHWLADESSASVTSRRDPGGHALSAQTAHDLEEWLDERLG
jgi:phospholipase/carboxylesterase